MNRGDWREITAAEAAALVKPRVWTAKDNFDFYCVHSSEADAINYCKTSHHKQANWTVTDPDGKEVWMLRNGKEWVRP